MENNNKSFNRRHFLSRAVTGLASVGLFGVAAKSRSLCDRENRARQENKTIITRTLGKTGIRIPIVNMGVMNTLDAALIKKSYDIGIRHFDTAAWYMRGQNEEMLGKTIKELGVRDKVVIGTKVFIPHPQRKASPEKTKEAYLKIANESLKRLQADYVDILYSHNVSDMDWLNNPGILEALQQLKKEGKARFIGFTTHSKMAECINDAVRSGVYDIIETAYNYAMADDTDLKDSLKKASTKGIGLVAIKTQCSQYWYRQYIPQDDLAFYEGKIMHTAVLKWALRNEDITTAIPGYTTFQQIEEDFAVAYDLEYTDEEEKFLTDSNVKLSLGYCRQCRKCIPTCPKGVDIPTLMRTHLYAACYPNFYQARDAIAEIPKGKGLDLCVACDSCQASCVNRIPIKSRIEELKAIYS